MLGNNLLETVIHQIITDLGPTGLLVIGLYFVVGKHLQKISRHVEHMNHELGDIRDLLKWLKQPDH
jgi:hypothetical protein